MGILKHIPEQITDRVPKVYFSCHKDDFDLCFEAIKWGASDFFGEKGSALKSLMAQLGSSQNQ